METRVYGIIGLRAKNSNWNADFDGYPKTLPDGRLMASDKSLKYVIRRFLEEKEEKIFYKKTLKYSDGLKVENFEERLLTVYPKLKELKKNKKKYEELIGILAFVGLMNTRDIRLFGTAATLPGNSFSIRGPVQLTHAIDKNKQTIIFEETITNVFSGTSSSARDSVNQKRSQGSGIGKQILTDQAHYFYSFSIIPSTGKEIKELIENIKNNEEIKKLAIEFLDINIDNINFNFNEQDYLLFKESAIKAVTNYNSAIKVGCENSFAMFIEFNNNEVFVNLEDYVTLKENYNKFDIILNKELLKIIEKSNKTEIFINNNIYNILDEDNKDIDKWDLGNKLVVERI